MNGLQIHLKGNPLQGYGGATATVTFGEPPFCDAGAWGTQFKKNDPSEAVRLWGASEGDRAAWRQLLGDVPMTTGTPDTSALQHLLGRTAQFSILMFIEWLLNHPDGEVRMQFIHALSSADHRGPMFEGL